MACVEDVVVVGDGSILVATVATRPGSFLTTCCESDVLSVVCGDSSLVLQSLCILPS